MHTIQASCTVLVKLLNYSIFEFGIFLDRENNYSHETSRDPWQRRPIVGAERSECIRFDERRINKLSATQWRDVIGCRETHVAILRRSNQLCRPANLPLPWTLWRCHGELLRFRRVALWVVCFRQIASHHAEDVTFRWRVLKSSRWSCAFTD